MTLPCMSPSCYNIAQAFHLSFILTRYKTFLRHVISDTPVDGFRHRSRNILRADRTAVGAVQHFRHRRQIWFRH